MVRPDEDDCGAIAALQVDDQRLGADLGGSPRIGLVETQSPHGRLGIVDPGRHRAGAPSMLLTTLPTPGRWWYLPMLRGDDHRRRTHRRHRREPTLARGQHTRPSLKKPPRFEGKLTSPADREREELAQAYEGLV